MGEGAMMTAAGVFYKEKALAQQLQVFAGEQYGVNTQTRESVLRAWHTASSAKVAWLHVSSPRTQSH